MGKMSVYLHVIEMVRRKGGIVAGEMMNFECPLKNFRLYIDNGESQRFLSRGVAFSDFLIFFRVGYFCKYLAALAKLCDLTF